MERRLGGRRKREVVGREREGEDGGRGNLREGEGIREGRGNL